MASRRAVSSAVRSAATIRSATWGHAASGQRCAAAAVLPASRAFTTAVLTRLSAASPTVSRRGALPPPSSSAARWYSADPSPTKLWSFDEIQKQLQTNEDKNVVFVDVREPVELRETGKIPGAINMPMTTAVQSLHMPEDEFEEMHGYLRPGKDKTLVFYCKAGIRAKSAAGLALHAGWTSVGEYRGSWLDWAEHNGPVEKVSGGK
ncbi:Rhodanese-like protein [Akanthomyces lecanii RCEF 1005]|uniref:Rhodanese-like protein n=1 Tax=Akanthomyces lecanii RCEF 1005 TaxID=1081108 RepID=A0A168JT01_CORDF|nr:Rhodanese-like protein [Akanthomyces lecanii RCEF 1005]